MPADDPTALADRIRQRCPMTMGTLTTVMSRADHPIGAFLREVGSVGAKALPHFDDHPLLVPAEGLAVGEHATIGTAFGWWLRLHADPEPGLAEAQVARGLLLPHTQEALWELDRWIISGDSLDERGDLERAAVVLAWGEQLYRAGPFVAESTPLLRVRPGDGPAEALDLVPDHFVDQLAELGAVADERLLPTLDGAPGAFGIPLGRPPIKADADLVADAALVEVKTTKGAIRGGRPTFRVDAQLVRQLLGYLLLDGDDELGIRGVAVYAARFGLYWRMPAADFIEAVSGRPLTLPEARSAFSRLWPAA